MPAIKSPVLLTDPHWEGLTPANISFYQYAHRPVVIKGIPTRCCATGRQWRPKKGAYIYFQRPHTILNLLKEGVQLQILAPMHEQGLPLALIVAQKTEKVHDKKNDEHIRVFTDGYENMLARTGML